MPRGTFIPNDDLLSILKTQGELSFRVTTIRDLFAKAHNDKRDPNEQRRWIKGQFTTLLKHGYIKIVSKSGVRTDYKITPKTSGIEYSESTASACFQSPKANVVDVLKTRLHDCKMEMLTSSGETKEYEELSKLFPDMRTQLQLKFNVAKEKNIEYIGRVKALELLITEHGSCD